MAKKYNDDDIIKRKPTKKEWDKIIAMYVSGRIDPEDIPAKFPMLDLDVHKVRKKLSLVGAVRQRKEIDEAALDVMFEVTKEERIKAAKDCIRLFNSGAEVIEKLLTRYNAELDGEHVEGKSKATAYNVDMLMSGVTKVQKGLRVAYGEDDKGNLFEKEPEVLTIEGVDEDKI